jgi:predicted nucleic acid-binding protein
MGPLILETLPTGALLLIDTPPIVYFLEAHPKLAKVFKPLFERHAAGDLHFAVTTVSIAEVLTGPLQSRNEALAERFRTVIGSWQVVDLTADIAASAARLRTSLRLKLADAVQAASAIAMNANAHLRSRFLARAIASRIALAPTIGLVAVDRNIGENHPERRAKILALAQGKTSMSKHALRGV